MPQDDLITRLARQIDAAKRAEHFFVNDDDVIAVRRRGACDLHAICAELVSSLNSLLSQASVDLSPPEYAPEMFRESGVNLIQVGSQGRQMQIAFQATPKSVSTEKFLIPYVLEGEVRTYNQRMLEHFEIRSQMIFYCLEADKAIWRFFDWRSRQTGPVNLELLLTSMGRLF